MRVRCGTYVTIGRQEQQAQVPLPPTAAAARCACGGSSPTSSSSSGLRHPGPQHEARRGSTGLSRACKTAAASAAVAAAEASSRILAFRPSRGAAAAARPPARHGRSSPADERIAALKQENAELRGHLETLFSHCTSWQQRRFDEGAAHAAPLPPPQEPQQWQRPQGEVGSPTRRPRSPGRTTLVVASPGADGGGAQMAVAVFEEGRGDDETVEALRLAANRAERQCLKLSSKLARAQNEASSRAAEARRWQTAAEQQAEQLAEARVQAETERRRARELEQALAAAQGDKGAAEATAEALLAQLRAVEATVAAVEGEAACLRGQLAVAEEQLSRARQEGERLKHEATVAAARLSTTDLVRRDAEREQDALEAAAHRLQAALGDAQARAVEAQEEGAAAAALARQQLLVERQRVEALAAQLELAQAQGRDNEQLLLGQLRAAQDERNACLAAATRADQLLVRLGQHAMLTRGTGRP